MIKNNLKEIQDNIKKAAIKSGRCLEDITLIGVTKTQPVEKMQEVVLEGVLNLGENKVQEYLNKHVLMPDNVQWHIIGHLQRNKVKYLMDDVVLIHSVDSLRLAKEIDLEGKKQGKVFNILIQVNIANELTKHGIEPDNLIPLLMELSALQHISVQGLMAIPPFVENPEDNRIHFRKLRQLSVDIKTKNIDNMSMEILSMGMSNDYMVAIEEGATMVRIGTSLFGARNYS